MSLISTVVDTANSYDLTTLVNVKAELGIATGDTTNDPVLSRYITSASVAAENYCNRAFVIESISDQFFSDENNRLFRKGREILQLSRWPIDDLTSVVENAVTLVENTDFIAEYDSGQITRIDSNGNKIHWSRLPITVLYDAGFENIPVDVEDAVIRMVAARYQAKGRDRNIKQENIPGVREVAYWIATGTDAGNMSPDITDILSNYRVAVVTAA